ncbi:rRNA-processing protein las1 [Lambiella insularis]|nr:rRNA-processing protein las1 [Lambiella insularis]
MKLQIVVDILLGFDMLVLCARPLGGSMKATFQVWETLLVAITNHQNKFLQSLNASMISRLVCATTPDCAVDSFREGLSEWLSYIWSSERWKKGRERSNLAFNTLMESCLSSPGYWTLHVAHCVVTSATWTSRRESWEGKILEAMKADKEASVAAGQNTVENAADETSAYKLGNMGAALLEVLSDDKSNENVSMAPPAPFFTTLAFRNSRNPWCATPVGTSNM